MHGSLATRARARAKVNLTLHILKRRLDGHHDLDSLVVFAGAGDSLSLMPGTDLTVTLEGPAAAAIGGDNLVLTAAKHLALRVAALRLGAFHLVKRLPVAAGIGGGSSDAAAALRLLARLNGLPLDAPAVIDAARATGADVPVCLQPRARKMGGVGERLGPVMRLPRLFAVLVNPGVPLATAAVFRELGLKPGQTLARAAHPPIRPEMTRETLFAALREGRNDLEAPALALVPAIGEALALVHETAGCRLARMSGSGATVFGLFDDRLAAAAAGEGIRRARPAWWVKPTALG